jgi:phospholipase C
MDQFVQKTEADKCSGQPILFGQPGLVMDYYDGNTVTGLWNYVQSYAMTDNSYNTVFGPSTPGALNPISGHTHGATAAFGPTSRFPARPRSRREPAGCRERDRRPRPGL